MTKSHPDLSPQLPRLAMTRYWICLGAILAALAVGLGAFGAHGLDEILSERHRDDPELLARRMDNWKTAALYQMHHSIGLILVGLVALVRPGKWLAVAGWCFILGILVFSGLLYALVVTEVRVLGAVVPIGGIAYIVGWIALAMGGCCLSPVEIVKTGDATRS